MPGEPPFKIAEDLPAVLRWAGQGYRVRICPTCWADRQEMVPILLELVGTFSMGLPDGTEVKRLAGSYRFCVRCSWSDQRGHAVDPRPTAGGGESWCMSRSG